MKNKGECIMNNENFKELERILNSEWRFFGTKNNEEVAEVAVDNEFICDVDNNFIQILCDFYAVESLNLSNQEIRLFFEKKIPLSELSNQHSNILRFKFFCRNELRKCLNFLEKNIQDFDFSNHSFPVFAISDYEDMLNILISNRDNDYYSLERLMIFYIIFLSIKHPSVGLANYMFQHHRNVNKNGWQVINFEEVLSVIKDGLYLIDSALEIYEKTMLSLVHEKSIMVFERVWYMNRFADKFCELVKSKGLKEYAFKKLCCYASMKVEQKIYMTFNGIEKSSLQCNSNRNELIKIFKTLVSNLNYVIISNDVRYYTEDNEFITYQQFMAEEPEASMNRMFTCCERKLLAKFIEFGKDKVELAVTMSPCEFCKRAIKSLNNDIEDNKIIIRTAKLQELENVPENLDIDKYDNFAKNILKNIKEIK